MDRLDFVTRINPEFVDRLYEQYQRDPRSVDESWRDHFAGMDKLASSNGKSTGSTSNGASSLSLPDTASATISPESLLGHHLPDSVVPPLTIGVHEMVHSYRELGHLISDID